MTIQDRILELLKKNGWTKYKLAKEAGFILQPYMIGSTKSIILLTGIP